jgi:hypothetical protein
MLFAVLIAVLRAKGDSSVPRKRRFRNGLALETHSTASGGRRCFRNRRQNERNRADARFLAFMGETFVSSKPIRESPAPVLENAIHPGPPARASLAHPTWRVEMLRHKEMIAPGYSPAFAATLTLNDLSRTVPHQTFES